ncbi:MAG: DUF11 domain-containing protein [Anaerolineales bacterium]|nr:DUF11 domain-containing protein [Anaerolineales bacterium]
MVDVSVPRTSRIFALLVSFVAALVFLLSFSQISIAAPLAADLSNSSKSVDKAEAAVGETLHYTIVISNSASGDPISDGALITMTDELPAELLLMTDTVSVNGGLAGTLMTSGNMITWTGGVAPLAEVTIDYDAVILNTAVVSSVITNTATIDGANIADAVPFDLTAETTVIDAPKANLDGSSKAVDMATAEVGDTLMYTLVVSNGATLDGATTEAMVVDMLPMHVDLQAGTLMADMGTAMAGNGVITWTGTLSPSTAATIHYAVTISDTAAVDDVLTNTAEVSGTNLDSMEPLTITASTVVVTPTEPITYYVMLPVIADKVFPVLAGLESGPNAANEWVIGWQSYFPDDDLSAYSFEVQESHDSDFSSFETILTDELNVTRVKPTTTNNRYYYRVRALTNEGQYSDWSNVVSVFGIYLDDFSDSSTGWQVIRQDTDDSSANTYYTSEGYLNLRVDGRWDYQISSNLYRLPEPPYRIETRVRLFDQSNLHSYGIVFNGQYDRVSDCSANNYTPCFNSYYRFLAIWYGDNSKLRTTLKRIDFHDDKNSGRGVDLDSNKDPSGNSPSQTWQDWAVERYPDGRMRIFLNNVAVYDVYDSNFFDPYFGFIAATDEYAGLDAQYDFVRIIPLNN